MKRPYTTKKTNKKEGVENDRDQKSQIQVRVSEIIQIINERQDILEQFEDDLFNALVEKITILSPTRYLFTLKIGLEMEEIIE
ncbi:hypothetical protein [Paenibacillus sp. SI8]|uniref:hypothetical protein n=1 Tax=unclassified Paenibacillus TaxID=185978 RepID=UPI0034655CA5